MAFSNLHAFILMSGGFDSTALACYYIARGYNVHPVKITYDSRQIEPEINALHKIVKILGLEALIELELPLQNPSSLSKSVSPDKVETGSYSEFSSVSTVVPGRNLAFMSMLANVAEVWQMEHENHKVVISAGVHSSDWEMYPDCRPDFLESLCKTIKFSTDGRVYCEFPFYRIAKEYIFSEVLYGVISPDSEIALKFKEALKESYSCYRGGKIHCGTCPTCRERHDAMVAIFGFDPTIYEKLPENQKKSVENGNDESFTKELVTLLAKYNIKNCEIAITHYDE